MSALISAWNSEEKETMTVADRCLDILMNGQESQRWREIIQMRKFEAYNAEWLERALTFHEHIQTLSSCSRCSSESP